MQTKQSRSASAIRREVIASRRASVEDAMKGLNTARTFDYRPVAAIAQSVGRALEVTYQTLSLSENGRCNLYMYASMPTDGLKDRKLTRLLSKLMDRFPTVEETDRSGQWSGSKCYTFGTWGDDVRLTLSIDVPTEGACRRVKVGTVMVEQDVYQNVCAE